MNDSIELFKMKSEEQLESLAESTVKYYVDKWRMRALKSRTLSQLENEVIMGMRWDV